MQDINSLMFDREQSGTPEELAEKLMGLKSEAKNPFEGIDQLYEDPKVLDGWPNDESLDIPYQVDDNTPKLKTNSVQEDIKNQKTFSSNKLKADIFNTLFAQEQQTYFDNHKHVMPSQEKRRLKKILIRKISNGDIYINKVGKLIIRKGKNK